MKIAKKLDVAISDTNVVKIYIDYLSIKEQKIPTVHELFYRVFCQKNIPNAKHQFDKVSKRLMDKVLTKLIKKLFTGAFAVRADVKIQKHIKNGVIVEFESVPFYDLETKTLYVMSDTLTLTGGRITKKAFKECIELLKDNKNPMSAIVYKIVIIEIKKFNFKIEELD